MQNIENIRIHCGATEVSPEQVDYNPEKLTQLDNLFTGLIRDKKLQCAGYLLSRYGKTFAHKSMGNLTYEDNSPDYMPNSIRRIASITKMFTAIAIMKLVEEGKVNTEDFVADIIKEFDTDLHRKIRIWHLLTHTSGICPDSGYFNEPYESGWWHLLDRDNTGEEKMNWIKAMLSGTVHAKPGEEWIYSTSCYMVLGEIITRRSGMDCEQYIIEKIVKPLGMDNTFFDVPKELYNDVCCTNEWNKKGLNNTREAGDPPRTGGGLYSTLSDLNKLGQMMLNKGQYNGARILGRKTVEAMTRNKLSGVPAFHWGDNFTDMPMGLGLFLSTSVLVTPGTFGHEGAGRSALDIDSKEGLVAAMFIPTNIEWVGESLLNSRAMIWSGLL